MAPTRLAQKLSAGQTVLGLVNMYPAPAIIEGMCQGYDFVWLDGQHGQHTLTSFLPALQACMAHGIDAMIRVPGHEYGILGPHADLAPAAIMVPMINTPEEAKRAVAGLRFPPHGERSYGGRRVIDLYGREYCYEDRLLVVLQIETEQAVANAEAIAATPGVNGLFFGADDMKVRMGIPINTAVTDNATLQKAMENTAHSAANAGAFAGCVTGTAAAVKMATALGYRLLACGGDSGFLRAAAANQLTELRAALAAEPQAKKAVRSEFY